ncbi:MAG: hypothetical protein Q9215_003504 [Flavoplaca cf. flavocitrina]
MVMQGVICGEVQIADVLMQGRLSPISYLLCFYFHQAINLNSYSIQNAQLAFMRRFSCRLPLLNVSRSFKYSAINAPKSSLLGTQAASKNRLRVNALPQSCMIQLFDTRASTSTVEKTENGSAINGSCAEETEHSDGGASSQPTYKMSNTTSKPEAMIQTLQNAEPDHPKRLHSTRFQTIKRIICYFPSKIRRAHRNPRTNNARRRIGTTAIFICAKENPKSFIGGTFAVSVVSLVLYWIIPMINKFAAVVNASTQCVTWWKDSRIARWLKKEKQKETYWDRLKSQGRDFRKKYWVKAKAEASADAKPSRG